MNDKKNQIVILLILMFGFFGLTKFVPKIFPQQVVVPTVLPTPSVVVTSSPTEMTIEEADKMFVEKYGKGLLQETKIESKTPTPQQPKKVNLDEKTTCWVDKNGTLEMTVRECQELHDANPFQFQVKAYQLCLAGKNPIVGDSGQQSDRKQKCSDLTGITEK